MSRKLVEAQLIRALDRNDSRAVREACIKLQSSDSSITGFLNKYYFDVDENGKIYSTDDTPFNFKYLNQFIADYLGTNNIEKINDFNKKLKDFRDSKVEFVEKQKAKGEHNY